MQSTPEEWGVLLYFSEGRDSIKFYGILLQGKFVSPLLFIFLLLMQSFFEYQYGLYIYFVLGIMIQQYFVLWLGWF